MLRLTPSPRTPIPGRRSPRPGPMRADAAGPTRRTLTILPPPPPPSGTGRAPPEARPAANQGPSLRAPRQSAQAVLDGAAPSQSGRGRGDPASLCRLFQSDLETAADSHPFLPLRPMGAARAPPAPSRAPLPAPRRAVGCAFRAAASPAPARGGTRPTPSGPPFSPGPGPLPCSPRYRRRKARGCGPVQSSFIRERECRGRVGEAAAPGPAPSRSSPRGGRAGVGGSPSSRPRCSPGRGGGSWGRFHGGTVVFDSAGSSGGGARLPPHEWGQGGKAGPPGGGQ